MIINNHRVKCIFAYLIVTLFINLALFQFQAIAGSSGGNPQTLNFTVWCESPTVKVKKHDPARTITAVWNDTAGIIHLSASRGEWESFQAVINVDTTTLCNVSIELFKGHGGTIPTSDVDIFQIRYPTTTNSDWPDPMVPIKAPVSAETGSNNPFLIDIHVSNTTAPGTYYSNVTIDIGGVNQKIPIKLVVWDITTPSSPTLTTWFDDAASNWASFYGYSDWSAEHQALMRNVYKQYARYKIMPGNCILGQVGRYNMTVDAGGTVSVDFSGTDPWLDYCLNQLGFRNFRFPLTGYTPCRVDKAPGSGHPDEIYYWGAPPFDMNPNYTDHVGQYIKLVADHYKTKGWLDNAMIYVVDEPIAFNNEVTNYWAHPNYKVVRQYYNLTHAQAPDIKFINTVGMIPELWDYTSIWAVPGSTYHELDASDRNASGQSVWWYNTDAGIATDGFKGRVLYWDTFARGVNGALYWGTNYWDYDTVGGDPWQGSNSNGDGYLFYPGNTIGITDNVVPSQRLVLTRDGIEDYELLCIYGQKFGIEAARSVAESVAEGSFFAGSRYKLINAELIYSMREWLAQQITKTIDYKTWTDTYTSAGQIESSTGLSPDFSWGGDYRLAVAYPPVAVDPLDSLGGWHSNDQANMNSSLSIDTGTKVEGAGSLKIEWWRNDNPSELGGYNHMRNGRVVTSSISPKDWSGYDYLEMDVRSVEHLPGDLYMLIGDSGGDIVSSRLHDFMRYSAGCAVPPPGWKHVFIDISGMPRSDVQYIEPIQYNYHMEYPYHHYTYWLDNITVRKSSYTSSGYLQSKPIDLCGSIISFAGIEYLTQWNLPSGTSVSFQTRTSSDGSLWSPWLDAPTSGRFSCSIASAPNRFIQYRVNLTSTGAGTPVLSEVRINYRDTSMIPEIGRIGGASGMYMPIAIAFSTIIMVAVWTMQRRKRND